MSSSHAFGIQSAHVSDELFHIIKENSFGRKRILLSSGRESDFYFDMKPSMLHPRGANLIGQRILHEVRKVHAEFVGGLEMGAVPITGAVSLLSDQLNCPVQGFFVRKKEKEYGAKKLVEGLPPEASLAGKRVVIVEDVTTTGQSALKAVKALTDSGANIVLVISIVDRGEGAAELFEADRIAFKALFSADQFLNA